MTTLRKNCSERGKHYIGDSWKKASVLGADDEKAARWKTIASMPAEKARVVTTEEVRRRNIQPGILV